MSFGTLDQLEADLVGCRKCSRLVEWRELVAREKRAAYADWDYWAKPVPGFGDPDAHLVIVGLAPGAHGSNRTGRMFTGDKSGDFLFPALHRAGFASQPIAVDRDDGMRLENCFITAPVKCAPPGNKPTVDERDTCALYLAEELRLLPIQVVVALGLYGWDATLRHLGPLRPKPKFTHGAETNIGHITMIGSYHPSQQNTFTGKLTVEMFDAVFDRARQILTSSAR